MKYVALLRGINVGGNNKISMAELKTCFEALGHENVRTYINSGNVIFESGESNNGVLRREAEECIKEKFGIPVQTLVIESREFKNVIDGAPARFGKAPEKYHSDVAFLIGGSAKEAVTHFEVNPVVDSVWEGESVVYYQRLSSARTKSRLSKIVGKPIYKTLTIRNWNTVNKLAALL